MEYFTLQKANGYQITCVKSVPSKPVGIVIVVHGFTSSIESPTVQLMLKRMPQAGIGVVGIDLPAHGDGVSAQEPLRLPACMDSVAAAERYVAREYPDKEICYFASSFGAYVTGLYCSTRPHKGKRAFFRSAAVNMPSLFIKDNPNEAEKQLLRDLEEKGYMQPSLSMGSEIRVSKEMIRDLAAHDLFALFDPCQCSVKMAHGAADETIDPDAARRFADRFHLPIVFFPGEGHSLSNAPDSPDRVADLAIEWFRMPDPLNGSASVKVLS